MVEQDEEREEMTEIKHKYIRGYNVCMKKKKK